MGDITDLIELARGGERGAVDRLFAALYPELRRIAHTRLRRGAQDTLLETTALVHECYLKLCHAQRLGVTDREHFMAYAASAMRSIIVDAARSALSERRGGDAPHQPLDTQAAESVAQPEEQLLEVDAALSDLAKLDARMARVVEMRYFGGMSDAEVGAALGITDRTVRRDWDKARLLLAHALRG